MIIGIDASRANGEEKTGVGWYCFHLIEGLKKSQSEVTVRTPTKASEKIHFVLYTDKPLKGELARLPKNWESKVLPWPPGRLWTQIRLSGEMLVNPPDILFIPAHVFPIIHPQKTVMMVHDVAALKFPESYNWFERWYSLWAGRQAVKRLWKIIVPSDFTKNELLEKLKSKKEKGNVFVVQHGYDKRYRVIEDEDQIQKILNHYGIRKPFLLSVGRLEAKKNTARLIKAFDQLTRDLRTKTYSLVLVGKPGYGYEKVRAVIDASPYQDLIVMPGYVNSGDLAAIMNAAEALVFPSLYEGFGLPLLEAMACGTSMVASRGSSLEELGGEAGMYVDPLDTDDIARGVLEVLSSVEARENRRKIGFERIKEFSWENSTKETLRVLMVD